MLGSLFSLLTISFAFLSWANGSPVAPNISAGMSLTDTRNGLKHYQTGEFAKYEFGIGSVPTKNSRIHHIAIIDDQILFDVISVHDGNGIRISEDPTKAKPVNSKNPSYVLLGCSVTYGHGLNYSDTLANYFYENTKNQTIPIASGGWSLSPILYFMKQNSTWDFLPRRNTYVYVFIEAHIRRDFAYYPQSTWSDLFPFFAKSDETGRMEFKNSLREQFPIRIWWNTFAGNILTKITNKYLEFPATSQESIQYYCDLLEELKKTIHEKDPFGNLLFANHESKNLSPNIKTCLDRLKIPILHNSSIAEPGDYFPKDHHPTGSFNRKFTKTLLKQINELNFQPKSNPQRQ